MNRLFGKSGAITMNRFNKVWRTVSMAGMAAAIALIAAPAFAKPPAPHVNPPTLHGFCSLADPCSDNHTNTPTDQNPPVFAFANSGGSTSGTLFIDILVPNNLAAPSSFTISGGNPDTSGTATLFKATAWTSGQLDAYLGISASPTNPIGAYLPTTLTFQPTATGFWVYQFNLGTQTLLGNSDIGKAGQDDYLFTLGQNLAAGGYAVGFLKQSGAYGATANSGAILETSPPVPEPKTWAMMLLGFGAAGVAMRRRRKAGLLAQLA